MVNETDQAYAYTGDDPVNAIDPMGLSWYDPSWVHSTASDIVNGIIGAVSPIAKVAHWYYKKTGDQALAQESEVFTHPTGCTFADEESFKVGEGVGATAVAAIPFLDIGSEAFDYAYGAGELDGGAADSLDPASVGQIGESGNPAIRELTGGRDAAQQFFDYYSQGGVDSTPLGFGGSAGGEQVTLPSGTIVNIRYESSSGDAVVSINNSQGYWRIHFGN
jgi:hypothetical protein